MEWDPSIDTELDKQPVPSSDSSRDTLPKESTASPQAQNCASSSNFPNSPARKRKASRNVAGSISRPKSQDNKVSQIRAHSLVEKRYRSNLNEKISELRGSIPSLNDDSRSPATSHKYNKYTILTKAIEYIRHLETRNVYLEGANNNLKHRMGPSVEKGQLLDIKPEEATPEELTLEAPRDVDDILSGKSEADIDAADEPRGMIPIPEEFRRLRDTVPPQSHYANQYSSEEPQGPTCPGTINLTGGKVVGKLMLGSLAGLMLVDSFIGSRKEGNDDRGLFALPMPFCMLSLRLISTSIQTLSMAIPDNYVFIALIRGFLVFAMLGFALFLYLFNSKPKLGNLDKTPNERTSRSSSFPIEMSRNAWLTAIQTVWVPQHTMLLELLALILETHAYLTRWIFGWQSYSWLTGRTEEDEIARVRAWEIAIDAQLVGGDVEMSRSRLVLTLWASGTLPDTPARLMLKALHIRILFWQASRYSSVCDVLDSIGKYIASKQWQRGEDLVNNPTVSKDANGHDPLPNHLVALLQLPIDEVMTDPAIHQAYNLAWNGTVLGCSDGKAIDVATEDAVMLGSLDSLAVHASTAILQKCLSEFIGATKAREICLSQLELALRIAPPGSISYLRALAAAATICEADRAMNITNLSAALQLPSDLSSHMSLLVGPVLPSTVCRNLGIALDCAQALMNLSAPEHEAEALHQAFHVAGKVLSIGPSLDVLILATTCQLMRTLSGHAMEVRMAASFNEIILKVVAHISDSKEHTAAAGPDLQEIYGKALEALILPEPLKRRVSNASVDSGYGSIRECNQES